VGTVSRLSIPLPRVAPDTMIGHGAAVTGLAMALPRQFDQQALWDGFFARHYQGVPAAARLYSAAGVQTRQAVVDPRIEDVSGWGTGRRMTRYAIEALPLGALAVSQALSDAGLAAADLGLLAVASCTGYTAPGLDVLLARDLELAADAQRLVIGHMGCYAAVPGLGAVTDYVNARGRPAVLLCLELTSLHLQPPPAPLDQVVVHALFADAAAAVVVQPSSTVDGTGEYVVRDVVACTDPETASYMTWDVTDLGFRMGLSPRVPKVLAKHVRGVVGGLLTRHGLAMSEVDGWAVHPGGPRILDVVADRLELPAEALDDSRAVLRENGNCSSPTVLLILDRIRRRAARTVVVLAFGPGLTLYAALLSRVDGP
jgi:predicted naringenin-chalcone synthase